LPPDEIPAIQAHLAVCSTCKAEYEAHRDVTTTFGSWPGEEFTPAAALWDRLARQIAQESGSRDALPTMPKIEEPAWEQVAPGIACKLLGTDTVNHRVSMLVRLAPGAEYPPHTHAGVEELHLLDGELYIEDRKLLPGDYNHGEPGTSDRRVWSETGCTCFLTTSTRDQLA
jgi:anti-sigma factor ChrR (cupin superfamily)